MSGNRHLLHAMLPIEWGDIMSLTFQDDGLTDEQYIQKELKNTFLLFFNFSLELLEKIDPQNDFLKIAVVNMQMH